MKRYSSTGNTNSSGRIPPIVWIAGAISLVAVVVLGGGDSEIKGVQQSTWKNRIADIQGTMDADRVQKLAEQSQQRAREIYGQYGNQCVKIVNTDENRLGIEAGQLHIAVTPNLLVRDPVTGAPLAEGVCVMDHLGNFAILSEGGRAKQVFSDPTLGENRFTQETTKTLGGDE
ncbi:MAG: hypothetical protein AAFY26_20700 [Cyanobacteria bacterium J06638_22]